MQRMNTLKTTFGPVDMQPPMPEVDLCPAQAHQFASSQPMPIGQEDRSAVPGAIPASLTGSIDELIYLSFG
jgi:hypothetical protein